MRKIETRSQIVEALNRIDHKCIDNNQHFYDLRSLFEATADRLTAQDKNVLRTMLNNSNVEADDLKAVMDARLEEDILPDGSYYDPKNFEDGYTEWYLEASENNVNLWSNEFTGNWMITLGKPTIYYPENTLDLDKFIEFNDSEEAVEEFNKRTGSNFTPDTEDVDDDTDTSWWEEERHKDVVDHDGFYTDYTLYHNILTDEWVCVFGDRDLYGPEQGWYDAEFDTEAEAKEWFDSYNGFADDLDERLLIFGNKDRENKLVVTIHTGSVIDRFAVTVIKDNEQVFNQTYEYGRNASSSRNWSGKPTPYVSDILRALCDEYSIPKSNIEVTEGDNVFEGSGISKRKIQEFTDKYVTPIMNESLDESLLSEDERTFKRFKKKSFNLDSWLKQKLGLSGWTNELIQNGDEDFIYKVKYPSKGEIQALYSRLQPILKEMGAKKISKFGGQTTPTGGVRFTLPLSIQERIINDFNDAETARATKYADSIDSADISSYEPSDKILDKLRAYRDKGSRVNIKAIKDERKLLTYLYGALLLDWQSLAKECEYKARQDFNVDSNIINAIYERTDAIEADERSDVEKEMELPKSGLLTFESRNCWLPKKVLSLFIENNIPVHVGKRTGGREYDSNGRQWTEIEHLTLFPDEPEKRRQLNIAVHTNEGSDNYRAYTLEGYTRERISLRELLKTLEGVIDTE